MTVGGLRRLRLRGRNLRDLFLERAFGVPEVVGLLHAQPQARPIATELAEANRHLGRHRRGLGQYLVQVLARHAELLGHRHHRLADRRQHVLAQHLAGMHRQPVWIGPRGGKLVALPRHVILRIGHSGRTRR